MELDRLIDRIRTAIRTAVAAARRAHELGDRVGFDRYWNEADGLVGELGELLEARERELRRPLRPIEPDDDGRVHSVRHDVRAACTCGGNGVCLSCSIASIEAQR